MNESIKKLKRSTIEDIVFLTAIIILTILFTIVGYIYLDNTPATEEDFKPLKDQIIAIQKDPSLLTQTPGTIIVNEDTFTITLKNEKCRVSRELNSKTFQFVSEEFKEEDFSVSNTRFFFNRLYFALIVSFGIVTVFYWVYKLICWIYKRVNLGKKNRSCS